MALVKCLSASSQAPRLHADTAKWRSVMLVSLICLSGRCDQDHQSNRSQLPVVLLLFYSCQQTLLDTIRGTLNITHWLMLNRHTDSITISHTDAVTINITHINSTHRLTYNITHSLNSTHRLILNRHSDSPFSENWSPRATPTVLQQPASSSPRCASASSPSRGWRKAWSPAARCLQTTQNFAFRRNQRQPSRVMSIANVRHVRNWNKVQLCRSFVLIIRLQITYWAIRSGVSLHLLEDINSFNRHTFCLKSGGMCVSERTTTCMNKHHRHRH